MFKLLDVDVLCSEHVRLKKDQKKAPDRSVTRQIVVHLDEESVRRARSENGYSARRRGEVPMAQGLHLVYNRKTRIPNNKRWEDYHGPWSGAATLLGWSFPQAKP